MSNLNKHAIFSDTTPNFVRESGDFFEIFLRVAKNNIDDAHLVVGDIGVPMSKSCSSGLFDYFSAKISAKSRIEYHFVINMQNENFAYTNAVVILSCYHILMCLIGLKTLSCIKYLLTDFIMVTPKMMSNMASMNSWDTLQSP